jgi:type II secretion system protein J
MKKLSTGFTLIEIVVALAIFAMLGIIAAVGINTALKAREVALASNQRLFELQQAYLLLQNDLNQAVVRTTYDGARRLPPFATGNDGHTLLAFTRAVLSTHYPPKNVVSCSGSPIVGNKIHYGVMWRMQSIVHRIAKYPAEPC